MLLISYPFLPSLILLYLCLESITCLLQHHLSTIVVFLEYLFNFSSNLYFIFLLIRMLFKHRENLTREFLVVYECLFNITRHSGLIALVSIRQYRLVEQSTRSCTWVLHVSLPADKRAVFVFNSYITLFWLVGFLILLLLIVISQAFLGLKAFTKGIFTWTGADYHDISGRVVLSELMMIRLLIIIIFLIRLCFHEHVSILFGVPLILHDLSSILMQD